MKVLIFGACLVLSLSAPLWAQTTTATVTWNQPGVSASSDVAPWQFTLLPNPSEVPITLVHACQPAATTPPSLNCSAQIPNWVRRPLNATLTATNAAGSATSAPFTLTGPGTPGGVSISVTTTVTVTQ